MIARGQARVNALVAAAEANADEHERQSRQLAELKQNMARIAQTRAESAQAKVQRDMFAQATETMRAVSAQLNTVKAAAGVKTDR